MNLHLCAIPLVVALAVLVLVPPLVVFVVVEVVTVLRDRLAEAALKAAGGATALPEATVGQRGSSRRGLFAEYLGDAGAAWSPGVAITPAWVRQVTGCSRGLSPWRARALIGECAERGDRP